VSTEAGRTIDSQVLQGHVVNTIVAEAERARTDVIVLGTHGRSGFERLMLGSVTERVLRKAPCPVLTVPPRAPDVVAAGRAPFRHILCGTDYSPAAERAVACAVSLARTCGAHLTLLNVVEALSVYEPMVLETGMALIDDLRRDSATRLHGVAAATGVPDVAEVVVTGNPSRQILRRAEEDQADLIVIGVHSGLADRFHLGSVANHIVRAARCAVLSVR
jgi:nucleotide-binding universal stress UspA family protein